MARLIDADALLARYDAEHQGAAGNARRLIEEAPTISPDEARGVGEWIKLDAHKGMEQYKCSVCEDSAYVPECMGEPMYNYCPSCGAKMEVSE